MINNIALIILFGTLICNLSVGAYVIYKDHKRKLNLVFGILCLQIALWNLVNLLSFIVTDIQFIILFARLTLFSVLFIPSTYFYFAMIFIDGKFSLRSLISWFVPSLIMVPFIFTSYNVKGFEGVPTGYNFIPGALYFVYILYFIFFIGLSIVKLFKFYRTSQNSTLRYQAQYLLVGIVIASTVGITTNAILPLVWSSKLNVYGTSASLFFALTSAYAITRYKFLNVHIIWKQNIAKVFFILLLSLVGAGIIYVVFVITQNSMIVTFISTVLIIGIIQVIIVYLSEHYLTRNTLDLALPQKMVYPDALVQQHLDGLLKNINTILNEKISDVKNITVCIKDWRNKVYQSIDSKVYFSQHHALIHFFKTDPAALILSKSDILHSSLDISMQHELNAIMKKKSFTHALAIRDKRDIYGFIFFTVPSDSLAQAGVPLQDWSRWAQRFCEELRMILQYDAVTNNSANLRPAV